MAGGNVSDPAIRDTVADYLAAVTAQLPGPAAARVGVTDELRDGLMEARGLHQARGCSPLEATAAAIAEFGPPASVVAATGRLGRRLGEGFGRRAALAPTAAAVAGLAAVLADLTLLAILGGQALASPGSLVWAPVIVAACASLTRVLLAGRAARRCLATRATLT